MASTAEADSRGEQETLRGPELWQKVVETSRQALAIGATSPIDTERTIIEDQGFKFLVRLATSLAKKPKGGGGDSGKEGGEKKPFVNPFLPYDDRLCVTVLSPSHVLLLNKFNVVENHLLVITREFQRQTDPLNALDLANTLHVLRAAPHDALAFYNSGRHSGRSQPHKHVQIVPLPLSEDEEMSKHLPFEPLILSNGRGRRPGEPFDVFLPFENFCCMLPSPSDCDDASLAALLAEWYAELYRRCNGVDPAAVAVAAAVAAASSKDTDASPSYNLLLTSKWMMLVPRSAESDGVVALNALGFAGTIFVKSDEELQHVKREGPLKILTTVGVPT